MNMSKTHYIILVTSLLIAGTASLPAAEKRAEVVTTEDIVSGGKDNNNYKAVTGNTDNFNILMTVSSDPPPQENKDDNTISLNITSDVSLEENKSGSNSTISNLINDVKSAFDDAKDTVTPSPETKEKIINVLKNIGYVAAGLLVLTLVCYCFGLCSCNCLGFSRPGVRGGSAASNYQARRGNIPKGSHFSHFQSHGARGHFLV